MKATSLGDFEELVLMSVCILNEQAYAVSIKLDLEERLKKGINISAIHTALYRLEDKGFLTSKMEGATAERGGRRKRYFLPTSEGQRALARLKSLRYSMYQLIPDLSNA
ncbi:PadR family transcriptional regulator [Fulvivirga lutimaris]|uniref:PadR family transcriptional regulator n=1 Tax=Fulvivirga lutimaris TaxID=1819566 RepID=UPI0012BB8768|nr:helix-turn-helix transcriptional regulator [Fulvivirga lutimaris]MTI40750.1 PadR family transcriptional regulator [Fulvivirga lutimaris]